MDISVHLSMNVTYHTHPVKRGMLALFLLLPLFFLCLPTLSILGHAETPASAQSTENAPVSMEENAPVSEHVDATEGTAVPSSAATGKESETVSDTEGSTGENMPPVSDATPSWLQNIESFFYQHAPEIFSALSLSVGLLLAFLYRRGMLPLLSRGLHAIGEQVTKLEEQSGEALSRSEGKLSAFLTEAEPLMARLRSLGEQADSLGDFCQKTEQTLSETQAENQRIRASILAVAELLYGIFEAANLPLYAKERLADRYQSIVTSLSDTEEVPHDAED